MNKLMTNKAQYNQAGMVSILVTIVMMLVISLIVLGFSQVTRRNQREALDRQLSTQAYYAAESGVNYAQKIIQANPGGIAKNTNCYDFNGNTQATFLGIAKLNSSGDVAFSCLLVDPTPPSLVATPLALNSSVVWHIKNSTGGGIGNLQFTWSKDSSLTNIIAPPYCTTTLINQFPPTDEWIAPSGGPGTYNCNLPVLRVDLVQDPASVNSAGGAVALAQKTISFYLRPMQSGTATTLATLPIDFSTGPHAVIAECTVTSGACSVTLNFNPGTPVSAEYYARITTIYTNSDSIQVKGVGLGGSGPILFADGQAVIDSTGRAQDELRRVQVRLPLTEQGGSSQLPNFGVASTGTICKDLTVAPVSPGLPSGLYTNSCP